jgi:hypothetical protein
MMNTRAGKSWQPFLLATGLDKWDAQRLCFALNHWLAAR